MSGVPILGMYLSKCQPSRGHDKVHAVKSTAHTGLSALPV